MVSDKTGVLLSVIIPTKNRPTLVKNAVSAFAALPNKVEILVVDDGSERDCVQTVGDFCRDQPNCKYFRNAGRPGAAATRNTGLRLSKGPYVWFFDDDDMVSAGTVGLVLQSLETAQPTKVMLLPMSVRQNGRELFRFDPSLSEQTFDRYRSHGSRVNTSCAIFPRFVLETVGGWDEGLRGLDDVDLFLRCSKVCAFLCLAAEPVHVNVGHPRLSTAVGKQQVAKIQLLLKHWGDLTLRRKLRHVCSVLACGPLLNRLFLVNIRAPIYRRFAARCEERRRNSLSGR
jgi:glycosyltransferase involved in cell wall biosynthesis